MQNITEPIEIGYIERMLDIKNSIRGIPRSLIYVLLFAVLIRIIYLLIYHSLPDWELLTVDNYYHQNWAIDIASGNIFGDTTYFRAPLYVYCLAILYAVFGASLWVARIFGLAVGLCSIFLTYKIGARLFSNRIAVLACLFQAVFPTVLYFESELLLDSLFMLLLEFSFYRFLIWFEESDSNNSFWLGISVGFAAITRPTILVFVIPVLAITLFKKKAIIVPLKQILIWAAGIMIPIAPITIRNLIVGNELVAIATQGGINFYIGNNSQADGLSAVMPEPLGHNWQIRDITYVAEKETGRELTSNEVSDFWYNKAVQEIFKQPAHFIALFIKKIYFNFADREISNNRNLNDFFSRHVLLKLNPLSFGIIFCLSILALATGWRSHRGIRILSWTVIIYVLAVSIFFFNSRFRLPILPLYFILAAAGFESIIFQFRESKKSVIYPLAAAFAAGIITFIHLVPLPSGTASQQLTLRGLNYYFKNDFRSALPYLKEAALIDPSFPETNLNLGACYLRLGQVDSAFSYFMKEKVTFPNRALGYNNIASILLLQNKPHSALEEISKAIALNPYHEISQMIRLRAAAELVAEISPDSLNAVTISALEESPYAISALNFSAITLTNRKDPADAKILLSKAISLDSQPIETDDYCFTPYYGASKESWTKEKAKANYQLGFIYGLEGNFPESVKRSREAIKLDSNLVEAYINLSNGLVAQGNHAAADSISEIIRSKFPENLLIK